MKVALVIPRFDPHVGGAERWTWDFASRLLRDGHEVHVVAEQFANSDCEASESCLPTWRSGGLERSCVPHRVPPVFGTATMRRFGFAARAEDALRRLDLDVIHDMGHGWYCNVFMPHGGTHQGSFRQNLLLCPRALRWAKRVAAPWLPRYRTFRRLEQRQYLTDGSRLFMANSSLVRNDMRLYHKLPDHLIRVVHNGVDTERFSPAHRELHRERVRAELGVDDALVFLLVAHNFKLKGVGPAIEATARLARERQRVCLIIVGKRKPGRYARLAQRLGCRDRVHFAGAATDPVPFYAAADVYLYPTYYDTCSLVVLEALASGIPVISTVHNGGSEMLTPEREGFLLDDPADVAGLADRMRRFLDADFRSVCGRRARALAEQHDVERNYREILAVYEEARRCAPLAQRRAAA